MTENATTPAVAAEPTEAAATPAAPKTSRTPRQQQLRDAATRSKAKRADAKAAAPKAAKVRTPTAPKSTKPLGPAPKTHPFPVGGCLVMLGDPTKPAAVKVAFLSTSIMLDDSINEAVKAGAVTADQVKAGHVFACQTRNVWQRLSR